MAETITTTEDAEKADVDASCWTAVHIPTAACTCYSTSKDAPGTCVAFTSVIPCMHRPRCKKFVGMQGRVRSATRVAHTSVLMHTQYVDVFQASSDARHMSHGRGTPKNKCA
jgi:hypothetical protein